MSMTRVLRMSGTFSLKVTPNIVTEGQEVPFGAGGVQHVARIDAQPIADQGDLVDQGDVDVALGVFQHLGELGDADRGGAMGAGADHAAVGRVDDVQRLWRVGRHDLQDGVEAPLLVAGIDALGRVADVEVDLPFQAGCLFEDGNAHFLGDAGIDGRFVDDDVALLQDAADGGRGAAQRREIRLLAGVDRGGDRDDMEVRRREILGRRREAQAGRLEVAVVDLARPVVPLREFRDASGVDIETQDLIAGAAETCRDRQADIAEANDGNMPFHSANF